MSEIILDCRGLPCPQPVLTSKRRIEESAPEALRVLVDNEPARENVSRFLTSQGYAAKVEPIAGGFAIVGRRAAGAHAPAEEQAKSIQGEAETRITVFITAETIGRGDDGLGGRLMLNFLSTLPELGNELWRLVLVNGGVRLAVEGHPCLEKLQHLEAAGISILVCGTCLEHYGLLDKRRAGQTTNMLDVVTSLQLASKVIHV
ncbi:sulfurtransferase-like selenium metabolism protein YedF [Desulfovibrio aminophilus]|uniref:sulfurtransferase-like selenium metabolism protein YedF n=1 Tax=Desulfovibrio aminophilus TaxID=81425 RepID=UPI003393F81E